MVIGESPNLVLVPANSPYKTFADFLADAKANPGKINYASAGPGSSIHMVTALFELPSGARMTHVPYKGSGPALVDLIGGQIQVMFDNLSSGMPHVQSGKLRVLAVTSAEARSALARCAHHRRGGRPRLQRHLMVHAGGTASMPAALVEKINKDVRRVADLTGRGGALQQAGHQLHAQHSRPKPPRLSNRKPSSGPT